MEKIKVMAVTDSEEIRYDIKNLLAHEDVAFMGFSKSGVAAIEKAVSLMPNVILITHEGNQSDATEVAERMYLTLPGCSVILLSKTMDFHIIDKAMLAGARKVLVLPVDQKTLIDNIKIAYNMEKTRISNHTHTVVSWQSRVITVFGTKGGIGKTTVAVNLAVGLSQMGKKVALIDADLQFGDTNILMDFDPKDTIAELVQDRTSFDIDTIKSFTMLHNTGVTVLCAPKSPEHSEYVTGKHLESIINTMRPYFDYIIVDTSPLFNDSSLVAIENSNIVMMLTVLDISTLRNAKISMDIFESLQQKDKIWLMLNQQSDSSISVKDVERMLGMPVRHKIPLDWKTANSSLNKGSPIIVNAPRTPIAVELKKLAGTLVNDMDTGYKG